MNAQPDLTPDDRLRSMCDIAGVPVKSCYRAGQTADILGVSRRSINRLHSSDILPHFRLLGINKYTDWHALTCLIASDIQSPDADTRLRTMCEIAGVAIKTSYDTQDLANILSIHRRQVYSLLRRGHLPAFQVNNHRRVDWPSLVQFIAS